MTIKSTIDWCEPNYYYNDNIAEFWNTISSIFLIYLGIYGYYQTKSKKILLLSIVGIGSVLFHVNLTWKTQLLDEIPMLFTVCYYLDNRHRKYHIYKIKFLFTTLIYIYFKSYLIFTSVFTMLLFLFIVDLSVQIMVVKSSYCRIIYINNLKLCIKLLIVAFLMWNIDHILCFYKINLHTHMLWHLFSGYAIYILMLLQFCIDNKCYIKFRKCFPNLILNTILPY